MGDLLRISIHYEGVYEASGADKARMARRDCTTLLPRERSRRHQVKEDAEELSTLKTQMTVFVDTRLSFSAPA